MTKSEYQTRIDKLQRIVNKFESRLINKPNGRFSRATRLLGLALAIADMQMEMFAYATDHEDEKEQGENEMSVMVLRKESFDRIGKYLSLTMTEEHAKAFCMRWHELNIRNYCMRYSHLGEEFEGLEFIEDDLVFYKVAIPSAVQVMSDLQALHYNVIDFGDSIDNDALVALEERIDRLKASDEYKITRKYEDRVKY